jgi:hypothetical protein
VSSPIAPSGDGRDAQGRFAAGNPGGPGNPFARQAASLRSALFDAVTPEDLAAVIRTLVAKAKEGNVPATRELLDRLLGKPEAIDLLDRLAQLEQLLAHSDLPYSPGNVRDHSEGGP